MKLYTEEQVKEMLNVAKRTYELTDNIINEFVSIELPSDEDIKHNANDYSNSISDKNGTAIYDYTKGAKWMKEQILNQNK